MKKFIALAIGFLSVLALSAATHVAKAEKPVQLEVQLHDSCTYTEIAIAEYNYNFVFETNVVTEANFIYLQSLGDAYLQLQNTVPGSGTRLIHPDLATSNACIWIDPDKPNSHLPIELCYQLQRSRYYEFKKYLEARSSLALPPILIC